MLRPQVQLSGGANFATTASGRTLTGRAMNEPRRPSMAVALKNFACGLVASDAGECFDMPTTQMNIVFGEQRVLAGDLLHAKILIDSADPDTIIHSLIAEIKGVGRTGWVNIHTDKIFETEKIFVSHQLALCPEGTPLPLGKHQFPFQVLIPENAPSSYESQFGTVRYQIKVSLNASTEQASCTEIFPVVVLSRSFFDDVPMNVLSPIDFKDEVDFTCCSLPFGTVSIMVSLPRTAYRIGESIDANVTINNRTRKGLKDCNLLLSMKTQFEARSRYEHVNEKKLSEQLIELVPLGSVRARNKALFEKCSIRIPDGAPPTQTYNRGDGETAIIAIHYVLKLTALPGIECEIPIIVTSRGYRDQQKHAAFLIHQQRRQPQRAKEIVEDKLLYC